MQIELVVAITITSTIIGVVVGLLGYNRNRDKDIRADAEKNAQFNVKLNHIIKGVSDVKDDMRTSERQMKEYAEQLIRVDESAKSAHKRIDKIETKI